MKDWILTVILAVSLVFLSAVSLFVGVIDIQVTSLLAGNLEQWEIFIISRLPRLLAILCTGIGMSTAGLIMQQLCMNKFVSPTTGATISSAQFGILLALLFWPGSTLWGRAIFAFTTAVLGTWIFVWFIQRIQFKDVVMVPLVGIMFGNVIGGITNYLAYKYEMTQALSSWLVGHFSLVLKGRYEIVYLVVPLVILAFLFANHFNIVGMGKEFSKNLGIHYNLILFMGLTIAAMITASVVVVVGSISYIGLIVPNIIAMFKGDKIRGTLVDTALFGAIFVLVCDMIGRVVIMPYELPIELIVGIVGSVLFIALLLYRLKNGRKVIRLKGAGTTGCGSVASSLDGGEKK
ncbi:MAG TPA: iron chelate uptake ABC transporter family permease subunit [Candidatus Fimimorpha faecalis]|uniref:Iron chelate uptake ABC transporter family permease subunit n=1 Tax=Candidatus Fimimorpha faecalis TaxID=2840824 RepID=A0A9D1JCC8_9FIRM|nr:iron chelate uptake ABC transporter family permease subunit [Candidatus Fimimorpha faecalis]